MKESENLATGLEVESTILVAYQEKYLTRTGEGCVGDQMFDAHGACGKRCQLK